MPDSTWISETPISVRDSWMIRSNCASSEDRSTAGVSSGRHTRRQTIRATTIVGAVREPPPHSQHYPYPTTAAFVTVCREVEGGSRTAPTFLNVVATRWV